MQNDAESQLKRYQTMMKFALDGIHVMDACGNILEANDSFCNMLGYTQEEVCKLNVADWNAQWPKEELLERLNDLLGKSAKFETVHRRKDGSIINVEVSASSIDVDGKLCFLASSRDITERRRIEHKNEMLMLRQQALMSSAIEGIHIMDIKGNLVEANDTFAKMLGYTLEEVRTLNVADWDRQWSREELMERFRELIHINGAIFETRHCRKDGEVIDVEVSTTGAEIDGKKYLFASSHDITMRKQAELNLRVAAIAFESQESMMITDSSGVVQHVNKAFTESTGYTLEEIAGNTPSLLKSGRHDADFYRAMWETIKQSGKWEGEIWDRRKNGEIYPKWLTISAVKGADGNVTNYVGSHIDITERKAAEEKIRHLAFYDPLTSLPNRQLLLDRLQQSLAAGIRSGLNGALLFIDLDNFKSLNDTLGHVMGDMLLQQVAQRLTSCVREGDTVARLGGDEFVVMLEDLSEHFIDAAKQAEAVGEKILASLGQHYQLGTNEFHSTASIGATLISGDGLATEELLKQADIAMYQAKKAGRNTLRFFDPQMQDAINSRVALESEMHKALEHQQFQLYFQIQVKGVQADGMHRPLGAEALIRWNHPVRGVISPLQFIPLAEENGLILPIGHWVLDTACAQLKEWQKRVQTRDLILAVNVSARQFHQPDFVAQVRSVVDRHSINPKLLKLELTESLLLGNINDTVVTMNGLNKIGVRLSLDDFGTGYSSLQYLKLLPLNQIKIDQSFVRDIATDQNDAAIVQTIIAMAESMGLDVIAEGVETRAQHEFLELRGCRAFQGYLFGKPVPIDEFERFLNLI